MKNNNANKVFWGIMMLLTAVSLLFYGIGYGADLFGLPLYKLIMALVLTAWVIYKLIFENGLRDKLRVFTLLSLLFMVLESEIARFAGVESDIINNWLLLAAGILIDVALGMLIPKKAGKKTYIKVGDVHIGNDGIHVGDDVHINNDGVHVGGVHVDSDTNNAFSNETYFIDASAAKRSYQMVKMGNREIYFQNTDMVADGEVFELELECKMGNMVIHVPDDWEVHNDIHTNMGSTSVRENKGSRVRLNLSGVNKMGNIEVKN